MVLSAAAQALYRNRPGPEQKVIVSDCLCVEYIRILYYTRAQRRRRTIIGCALEKQ